MKKEKSIDWKMIEWIAISTLSKHSPEAKMLDHLTNQSERAAQAKTRPFALKSRHAGGLREFTGVDLVVSKDGPVRDLLLALRHTGLERLFVLRSVSRGDVQVWTNDEGRAPFTDLASHGPWLVRFDVTTVAGKRAEAHLPRLLESIGSRMVWQEVRKRFSVSLAAEDCSAASHAPDATIAWKGEVA